MGRIPELDAIRGVAAVVIMLAHIGLMPDSPWIFSIVDLFFVLSGYLITKNVLKNRTSPYFLPVFFTRRALRIWPAYYLAFAVCLLLNRYLKWDHRPDAWPFYLTFTQNVHEYFGWRAPAFSGMFLHTWTLAIEEQFYLVWPTLLYRGGRRWVTGVVVASVLLPLAMRLQGFSPYLLLTRCDGLAFGSLLALLLQDRERVARNLSAHRWGFALIGLVALVVPVLGRLPTPVVKPGQGLVGHPLVVSLFLTRSCVVYFGLAGFLLCAQGLPALRWLRLRAFCHMGVISYGLYLYHPMVFGALPRLYQRFVERKLGLTSSLLRNVVLLCVCVILAELSRRLLEGPIQAWKDRITLGGNRRRAEAGTPAVHGPHTAPERPTLAALGDATTSDTAAR
jgi:peptidoglycan/LPS O-acetylase OafA/YrhL